MPVSNPSRPVSNLVEKHWCALGESNPSYKIEKTDIRSRFKGLGRLTTYRRIAPFMGFARQVSTPPPVLLPLPRMGEYHG